MGLHVYYSDKIEELAGDLKQRLAAYRAKVDPFEFTSIAVPNTNISKWLQIRVFADTPNLCAGLEFPFIDGFLISLLRTSLPADQGKSLSLLPMNAYSNAIMRILMERNDEDLRPFRKYVNGTGTPLKIATAEEAQKGWQLAQKLADLVDVYEVRRPDLIEKWLQGDLFAEATSSEIQRAEASLIRHLFGPDGIFPEGGTALSLRQLFAQVCKIRPAGERQTLYLFGISTLTKLQANILQWLSQTHEIYFYHNSVCLEFWGDIQKQITGDESIENPLLNAWGIAGRESMNHLVSIEEQQDLDWRPIEPADAAEPMTVLQVLQSGVRNRMGRDIDTPKLKQDASVQIFGAPGIRREVETVYNAILGVVREIDPDKEQRPWRGNYSFSDIAVLVPDMATYRPMIEAVFDARGQIPYGLIDTTASEDSTYLRGLLDLIRLQQEGLNRDNLFAVLANPCVQYALGFTTEDLAIWKKWVKAFGGFGGFDSDDLAGRGQADEKYFTWNWMLKRLRLGCVAEELPLARGAKVGSFPLGPTNDRDALLRFSVTLELLYRELKLHLPKNKRLPCVIPRDQEWQENWYHHIAALMGTFLSVGEDDMLENEVRRQILRVLHSLEAFHEPQSLAFVTEVIKTFVGGLPCRKGGYLTHGVTIAGLQPMRPVPFKQVFILGLGEGSFPGTKSDSTLDLRGLGQEQAVWEAALPEVNRYLFLETLMATVDRLVLSYPNLDICKDAELFPCSMIRTLKEWLDKLVEGGFEMLQIPLLERDSRCTGDVKWRADDPFAGLLPTYSPVARSIAGERYLPRERPPLPLVDLGEIPAVDATPHMAAELIRDPFRAVMRYHLGIAVEGYQGNDLESESPLEIAGGPSLWGFQQQLVESDASVETLYREAQMTGMVPNGFLGEYSQRNFIAQCEGLEDARAFARTFEPNAYRKLVCGYFGEETNPPSTLLEAFCEAVNTLRNDSARGPEDSQKIEIGVICFTGEGVKTAVWEWNLSQKDAASFYDRVNWCYEDYLQNPAEEDQMYASVRYTDFMKGYERPGDFWNQKELDQALSAGLDKAAQIQDNRRWSGESSFNNDLTIEQAIAGRVRLPEVEEFKDQLWSIVRVAISGVMQESEVAE